MSPYETAWSQQLERMIQQGTVARFIFHPGSLRLPGGVRYEPDFMVFHADGHISYDEVKATWKAQQQDKSKIKLKIAAGFIPEFDFRSVECKKLAKKHGGCWEFTITLFSTESINEAVECGAGAGGEAGTECGEGCDE